MPRRTLALLATFSSLLSLHPAGAAHTATVGVEGPDADGAFHLLFDVHRDAAGEATGAFDVLRTDAEGNATGTRDLGPLALGAGTTRLNLTFLPLEGPGRYTIGLVLDGARAAEVQLDADDAAASATVSLTVPDAPTYVNLTNDDVNADGKVKAPGEALLTRATVHDANGMGDLDALVWRVERDNATLLQGAIPLPAANATSASLEHRFTESPFPAGEHRVTLRAIKAGAVVASASRTFVIREVATTFVSGALANVTPDADVVQRATIVLADRNGLPPAATLDARAYRGSARMEGAGIVATLGAPSPLADADGAARGAYTLELRVPARASPGPHRVSLYANGTLVASLPFEVLPLPTLVDVNATTQDGRLVLRLRGTGAGIVTARVADAEGTSVTTSAPLVDGNATITLDAPRRGVQLTWDVALRASEGGPPLASRNGTWTAAADGPAVTLAPLHVRPRLPAVWRVETAGDLAAANATITVTRWDGTPEPRVAGSLQGARVRLQAPADLPAGRYHARLVLSWANGTTSEASWSFDGGPWVQLRLGAPVVEGRNARLAVENTGGASVGRLVVETRPDANVVLEHHNTTLTPTLVRGRAVFTGLDLAPGANATLVLRLPDGPHRAGTHAIDVRVLARVRLA